MEFWGLLVEVNFWGIYFYVIDLLLAKLHSLGYMWENMKYF